MAKEKNKCAQKGYHYTIRAFMSKKYSQKIYTKDTEKGLSQSG